MQAVYQGEGWLAIGFSDSGNMPGSDSVIGLPEEGTVFEYDMDDYSRPEVAIEQAREPKRGNGVRLMLRIHITVAKSCVLEYCSRRML